MDLADQLMGFARFIEELPNDDPELTMLMELLGPGKKADLYNQEDGPLRALQQLPGKSLSPDYRQWLSEYHNAWIDQTSMDDFEQ
jgi:hypothetical protein